MTTLLLIRHGETDWNVEGRYTGQSDIPLNNTGRKQAEDLANRLQNNPPDVIISSDLRRARETANAIAAVCNITIHTDARLREIHQGVWEGMLLPDIKTRFSKAFAAQRENPLTVSAPDGETVGQVHDRVFSALKDILHTYPGHRIAIVAHGLVLALVKTQVYHHPITKVWDLLPPNAESEEIRADAIKNILFD
ncbi:MAG: histidine phosphatase family protein [Pseudomonadota bacterium]